MFSFSAGARAKRVFSKVSTLGVVAIWDDCIDFPKIRGHYSNPRHLHSMSNQICEVFCYKSDQKCQSICSENNIDLIKDFKRNFIYFNIEFIRWLHEFSVTTYKLFQKLSVDLFLGILLM